MKTKKWKRKNKKKRSVKAAVVRLNLSLRKMIILKMMIIEEKMHIY
jgi:hypothetical protein